MKNIAGVTREMFEEYTRLQGARMFPLDILNNKCSTISVEYEDCDDDLSKADIHYSEPEFKKYRTALFTVAKAELSRIDAEIARLESNGVRMTDGAPPDGAKGRFVFECPKWWGIFHWGFWNNGNKWIWMDDEGYGAPHILRHAKIVDAKRVCK